MPKLAIPNYKDRFSYILKQSVAKAVEFFVDMSILFQCLHIVNFSDFQMDSDTGHFKGEIRLAYCYNEDVSRTIVTGGSINGSIFEAQKEFIFSKECQNLP